ncbi:transposase [Flavipsychrobacter stenotrophus]|uniref:Transposase n=1 Tax=Flavipsychrobacter stenotrophus TaxID=2077091 RepID=A0A2S7SX68_9BACT|nr:IS200/IS605 family transposase [Flavipsychrobacter stenotrophus]PQJ11185.1 transposase [Flavipsychrobacter stenotrophus]
MGQSLINNYVHIIFSTKNREQLIYPPVEQELYDFIGKECTRLACQPLKVGGHVDHVHILCMLSQKIALMNLVKEIKAHSSIWMKSQDKSLNSFYWQNGYGAFSVNPAETEKVIAYIDNQHEHHKSKTYQDEYRAILKKYKVDYDERYVWD